jgi:hypothetical protein
MRDYAVVPGRSDPDVTEEIRKAKDGHRIRIKRRLWQMKSPLP